jgi:hypothetical protein
LDTKEIPVGLSIFCETGVEAALVFSLSLGGMTFMNSIRIILHSVLLHISHAGYCVDHSSRCKNLQSMGHRIFSYPVVYSIFERQ